LILQLKKVVQLTACVPVLSRHIRYVAMNDDDNSIAKRGKVVE
jgi:hypothetical protein